MADSSEGDEKEQAVSREILAPPPDPPRSDMIDKAMKFLQNPSVRQSPLAQRKAFLEKKGLTHEEIDLAIERSGAGSDVVPPPIVDRLQTNKAASIPVALPSQWSRVRDTIASFIIVGGISYTAYNVYKKYILPHFRKGPSASDRLEKIETSVGDLQVSVMTTLDKVQETLDVVKEVLSKQQTQVQSISDDLASKQSSDNMNRLQDTRFVNEIKSEIGSLKALLLNRRQFPQPPASNPVLPSWQLTDSITDKSSQSAASSSASAESVTMETNVNQSSPISVVKDNQIHIPVSIQDVSDKESAILNGDLQSEQPTNELEDVSQETEAANASATTS